MSDIKNAQVAVIRTNCASVTKYDQVMKELVSVEYYDFDKSAFAHINLQKFDAIVLNLMNMSCEIDSESLMTSFINQIRNHASAFGKPILCLDHNSSSLRRAKAFEAGANEFLDDDCTASEFEARFKNMLMGYFQLVMLEQLSSLDALTQVANRRAFNHQAEIEIARAKRENASLALAIIDIDCFKQYNDFYGHPGGDECLKKIAAALKAQCKRPGDIVARVGGEEFAVLLPSSTSDGLVLITQRLLAAVESQAIKHEKSKVKPVVTVSIGAVLKSTPDLDDFARLYSEADNALYEAKYAGRNRVIIY